LLVKTSSMGDVIHAMPAVTDAARMVPGLRFDWLVEEPFMPLSAAHPAVEQVVPARMRAWRGRRVAAVPAMVRELRALRRRLAERRYDLVLDAQGLYKSAVLTRLAGAPAHGFDAASAREPLASFAYQHRHRVARGLHAVERQRRLFAAAFGYHLPAGSPDYGLKRAPFPAPPISRPYVLFAHGTTWPNKLWPVAHWQALAGHLERAGLAVAIAADGAADAARAGAIAAGTRSAVLLPRLSLSEIAGAIAGAAAVVAVDTGLGHLAAAFGVPCISLYGPTATALTGTVGVGQTQLAATLDCAPCLRRSCRLIAAQDTPPPCMASLEAARVWSLLQPLLAPAPQRAAV
jgi:heptosyltransferase-1